MKITFLANQGDIGGGEVMLLAMADAARGLGHDVTVVVPSAPRAVRDAATSAAFRVVELPSSSVSTYLRNVRGWARTCTDDVLWCNGLRPAFATAGMPRRIVHFHQEPQGKQALLASVARARAIRVLVPSHFMKTRVAGAEVFENWVEAPRLPPHMPRRHDTHPVIGYIGRLSSDKGVLVLLKATTSLRNRGLQVRLLVAGEPRFVDPEEAERINGLLNTMPDTACPGWMDRGAFFSSVDAAVFPSVWDEPFGLVAAEAMAARVPFVVSDAGALPEVVGGEHKHVAHAGDAGSLADAIVAVLDARGAEDALDAQYRRWQTRYSPTAGRERMAALLADIDPMRRTS